MFNNDSNRMGISDDEYNAKYDSAGYRKPMFSTNENVEDEDGRTVVMSSGPVNPLIGRIITIVVIVGIIFYLSSWSSMFSPKNISNNNKCVNEVKNYLEKKYNFTDLKISKASCNVNEGNYYFVGTIDNKRVFVDYINGVFTDDYELDNILKDLKTYLKNKYDLDIFELTLSKKRFEKVFESNNYTDILDNNEVKIYVRDMNINKDLGYFFIENNVKLSNIYYFKSQADYKINNLERHHRYPLYVSKSIQVKEKHMNISQYDKKELGGVILVFAGTKYDSDNHIEVETVDSNCYTVNYDGFKALSTEDMVYSGNNFYIISDSNKDITVNGEKLNFISVGAEGYKADTRVGPKTKICFEE